MTAEATQQVFIATIKGIGEQGAGWKMEFDWKLPGSKFPFVLYGRDSLDIEGWAIGDRAEVTITQGNLKADKTGRYASDYFYDLVSLESVSADVSPRPKTPPPFPRSTEPTTPSKTPQDPRQVSIERQVALKEARLAWLDLTEVVPSLGPSMGGGSEYPVADYLALVKTLYLGFLALLDPETVQTTTQEPEAPPRPASRVPVASPEPTPDRGTPKNVGELLTWALKDYGMSKVQVLNALRVPALQDITDLAKAWGTLTSHTEEE